MEFSKEDFGYYFAQPAIEDKAKEPLNSKQDGNNDIVVSVDPEAQDSQAVDGVDEQPQQQRGGPDTAIFTNYELEFPLYHKDFDNLKKEVKKSQHSQTLCFSGCCCVLCICTLVPGALLIVVANNREFDDNDEEERVFFSGVGLLFISIFACLCTCLCGCALLCGGRNSVLNELEDGKPDKEFEIKLERLNDQYSSKQESLDKIRVNVLNSIISRIPHSGTLLSNARRDIEVIQTAVRDEIVQKAVRDMSQNYSPYMVSRRLRPTVFKISFGGDIMASGVTVLREQVSLILKLAIPDVDSVVAVITSPGGGVSQYGLAASQLVRIKNAGMKLIACVDSIAASGGYMMASVADEIYAAPFAMVGSIGVVSVIPNFHELLRKHNIQTEMFTAGKYKRTVTIFGEITDEGREKFLEEITKIHTAFKDHIVHNRPQLGEVIDDIATGEAFLAVEARKLGLVDHIKTSDDLLLELCENNEVINLKKKTKSNFFLDSFSASSFTPKALAKMFTDAIVQKVSSNGTPEIKHEETPLLYSNKAYGSSDPSFKHVV